MAVTLPVVGVDAAATNFGENKTTATNFDHQFNYTTCDSKVGGRILVQHKDIRSMQKNLCLKQWHALVESQNKNEIADLLDPEVVFHSPVVHTPQCGKQLVSKYLSAAFDVLVSESFRYTAEMNGDNQAVLEFEVALEDINVNGVDIISWNSMQKITEFKVMIRPLKAINLVHKLMAARLG